MNIKSKSVSSSYQYQEWRVSRQLLTSLVRPGLHIIANSIAESCDSSTFGLLREFKPASSSAVNLKLSEHSYCHYF